MSKWYRLCLACVFWGNCETYPQTALEASTQPFNFDTLRRTPQQSRTYVSQGTKEGRDLHEKLVAGYAGRELSFSQKATGLFSQENEDFILEAEPVPTRSQTTERIAQQRLRVDSKGRVDLLAKSQIKKELGLDSLSDSDYELYVSEHRSNREAALKTPETNLNPMPTLINSKTGGPPHAYSVSQAGLGNRAKPRSGDNPFGEWLQFLQLDRSLTKGTDTWDRQAKPAEAVSVNATAPSSVKTNKTPGP